MTHARARHATLTGLALLTLLSAAVASDAAAPHRLAQQSGVSSYIVEVIIFRASSVPSNEDWDAVPPGRGFGSNASRGGPMPQVLKILPASDYRLGALEQSLKTSGAWHPLAHAAWVQTAANWGTHAGIDLADVGINSPALSGTVYLERAPIYMHLGFEVHLSAGANYTIREMRSVRYNDKQYFDHPAFGVIAMVTPVKRGETSAPAP
ncbi:MAG TPA: hypothetical protein VGF89_04665 [Steroidobacteraceae bacterium]|jgi:hypothetical protein